MIAMRRISDHSGRPRGERSKLFIGQGEHQAQFYRQRLELLEVRADDFD